MNRNQSSKIQYFKFLDVFGYEDKINRTRSFFGAIISVATFCLLCVALNQALMNIKDGYSSQSIHTHGLAEIPYKMPTIGITLSRDLQKHPYLNYNDSWARVTFHHRTIYESDKNKAKPRIKKNLGTTKCQIQTHPNVFLNAYCPENGLGEIQGEYASKVYEFIQIALQPCYAYEEEMKKQGKTCEDRQVIDDTFLKNYGGISLFIKDQINQNQTAWYSKAYTTFEESSWIGTEVFFTPTNYTRYGVFGDAETEKHYLTYKSFYQRRGPHNEKEYLKYYLRVDGKSKEIDEVLFGFSGSVEMVGGTWSVLTLTLGTLALIINMCIHTHKRIKLGNGHLRRQVSTTTFQSLTEQALYVLTSVVKGQNDFLKKNVVGKSSDAGDREDMECELSNIENPMRAKFGIDPKGFKSGVDIVFSFDTTGSMNGYLKEVRENLKSITKELFSKISNIRIAIIAHGDYCDKSQYYVLKKLDFTREHSVIAKFVDSCGGTGGGDAPECYEYALRTARTKLTWRRLNKANRCVVLIGDDEPHPPSFSGNVENICWRTELKELKKMNVNTYAIQCGKRAKANYFYEAIGNNTEDSKRLELSEFKSMPAIFVGVCLIQVDPLGRLLADYEERLAKEGKLNGEQKKAFRNLIGTGAAAVTGAIASTILN